MEAALALGSGLRLESVVVHVEIGVLGTILVQTQMEMGNEVRELEEGGSLSQRVKALG